jgi:hypothetical protein
MAPYETAQTRPATPSQQAGKFPTAILPTSNLALHSGIDLMDLFGLVP